MNDAELRRVPVPGGLAHMPARQILAIEEWREAFGNLRRRIRQVHLVVVRHRRQPRTSVIVGTRMPPALTGAGVGRGSPLSSRRGAVPCPNPTKAAPVSLRR